MKTYGELDVYPHVFLTSAQDGGEWSALRPAALPPGKEPPVPIGEEAGWAPGRRGEEKILEPTGTRTPTPRSSSQ
jgi:hypothetical protein